MRIRIKGPLICFNPLWSIPFGVKFFRLRYPVTRGARGAFNTFWITLAVRHWATQQEKIYAIWNSPNWTKVDLRALSPFLRLNFVYLSLIYLISNSFEKNRFQILPKFPQGFTPIKNLYFTFCICPY